MNFKGSNIPNYNFNQKSSNDDENVMRIMEQLEVAIAHGQHRRAAVLARELAMRKVTCTLNRLSTPTLNQPIV